MAIHGYFDGHHMAARARRTRRPVVVVASGPLQSPRFGGKPRWVSGTVLHQITPQARRDDAFDGGWMEKILLDPGRVPQDAAGEALGRQIVAARIGGTFWAPSVTEHGRLPGHGLAILHGGGDAALAGRMLADALARHEAASIVLVLGDGRPPTRSNAAGNADLGAIGRQAEALGCHIVWGPVDPWTLLDHAGIVHAGGDDPLALLALLCGIRLRCHAPGIYAGWGLSDDNTDQGACGPARATPRSLGDLAHAVLVGACRYVDPFRDTRTGFDEIAGILADWRRSGDAARGIACCVGISLWKRRAISALLHNGDTAPIYRNTAKAAVALAHRTGHAVAVWPSRTPPDLAGAAQAEGVAVWNIEDGFVRSVGLGSDSMPPCSVILDRSGIYFDPRRPSDLETLLATTQFPPALLARAAALRARLVALRISKYNVGNGAIGFDAPPGKRRILVPGQVSDDLSMLQGGAGMQGNLQLLQQARAANRDAFVIYKPHPDVDAGHRKGAIPEAEASRLADAIVRGVAMPTLLDAVDEVHTITSLTGFEALLRGLKVVAYGQPFYAGWGLTEDRNPPRRRTRKLTCDELVAGALILYPRYLDPVTGLPCPPEVLVERLIDTRLWRPGLRIRARALYGVARKRLFGRG